MSRGMKQIIEKAKNHERPTIAIVNLLVRSLSAYLYIISVVIPMQTKTSRIGIHAYIAIVLTNTLSCCFCVKCNL